MRWVVGSDGVIGNLSGGGGGGVRSNRVITLQHCITFHFLRTQEKHGATERERSRKVICFKMLMALFTDRMEKSIRD